MAKTAPIPAETSERSKGKETQPSSEESIMKSPDSKAPTRLAVLKRLMTFCKPESPRIALGFVALGINAATNLSFPYILGKAVDSASSRNEQSTLKLGQTAGIFLVGSLASWVRIYCLGTATDMIANRLRLMLFDSYIDMSVEFFDASTSSAGELMSVLEKDVDSAALSLTDKLAAGLRSLNSSLNGSILLYYTSPRLCAVSLAIVPLVGVGAMTMSKYARKLNNQLRELQSELMSFVLERFSGITTVRLNGREKTEKEAYGGKTNSCSAISRKSHFGQGAFMSFIGLSTNISLMAVLYVGGGLIASGEMTPGSLTQFAMQSAFVCLGFSGLSTFYSDMVKTVDAAKRVFNIIDTAKNTDNTTTESHSPTFTPTSETFIELVPEVSLKALGGHQPLMLELSDVSFLYASRPDQPVVKGISLVIAPRCITAICGRSGCGKSTLLGIIAGLYKPSSGLVRLRESEGGEKYSPGDLDLKLLRSQVGVVEQLAGLLSGTIRQNISYGKEGASEEEIEMAARAAAAHDFITQLPEGYNTQVGVRGSLLSGGQRARVALARALIKDPACLLLDEATAALDKESESEIIRALISLSAHKVVLVFTHSELLMQAAGVVHVMEEGKIVESGDFNSLKISNAGFQSLVKV
jgi:putative ABC transport system ATP-binding protein